MAHLHQKHGRQHQSAHMARGDDRSGSPTHLHQNGSKAGTAGIIAAAADVEAAGGRIQEREAEAGAFALAQQAHALRSARLLGHLTQRQQVHSIGCHDACRVVQPSEAAGAEPEVMLVGKLLCTAWLCERAMPGSDETCREEMTDRWLWRACARASAPGEWWPSARAPPWPRLPSPSAPCAPPAQHPPPMLVCPARPAAACLHPNIQAVPVS